MSKIPPGSDSGTINNLTLPCPECGGMLVLRQSSFGPFYGCKNYPRCRGTHRAALNGSPLGIPADQETKLLRIKAHQALEKLYKGASRSMTKDDAYKRLQTLMNVPPEKAHISMFNKEQCERLIKLLS
jgi:ssDNA-binding Zn-finger/Zn-ribbon topoisomerase 1